MGRRSHRNGRRAVGPHRQSRESARWVGVAGGVCAHRRMASAADLRSAFAAAWRHLRPGGIMVVTPDETKETFVQNQTAATEGSSTADMPNVEVVFVENSYDPDPTDDTYEATMVYMIRENGRLRVETDRHVLGLFAMDLWRETLTDVGFRLHEEPYEEGGKAYVTFACRRPTT